MANRFAICFGILFITAGVLGFVNNPIIGQNAYFATNNVLNIARLLMGAIMVAAAKQSLRAATIGMILFGIVHAAFAVLGYTVSGSEGQDHGIILGMLQVNGNDTWLHSVLAVILLAAGLMARNVRIPEAHGDMHPTPR